MREITLKHAVSLNTDKQHQCLASSRQVYVEVVKASDNDQTQDTYVTVKSSAYVGRNPVSGDYDSNDSTYNYVDWDGTHEDGSYVPNGSYQFRLRFVARSPCFDIS